MIRQSLHNHTIWDDGKATAEEMILSAEAAGLSSVGISLHAPMPFRADWTCQAGRIPGFIAEIDALKARYAGRIRVLCGIEWDLLSETDTSPFDYVIGSVHHLPMAAVPPSVDESPDASIDYLARYFNGDADAAAKVYFSEVKKLADRPFVQIVGHFDLITKFDERFGLYHPDSPVYRQAALEAMEALVRTGKVFEVNTGAISRGWRTVPYPSSELLCALHEMGGRVTYGADAHSTTGVACAAALAEDLIRRSGFREIWTLGENGFVPEAL